MQWTLDSIIERNQNKQYCDSSNQISFYIPWIHHPPDEYITMNLSITC